MVHKPESMVREVATRPEYVPTQRLENVSGPSGELGYVVTLGIAKCLKSLNIDDDSRNTSEGQLIRSKHLPTK